MNKADDDFFIPNYLSSDMDKAIFGCLYEGWLIARGDFNESKYE